MRSFFCMLFLFAFADAAHAACRMDPKTMGVAGQDCPVDVKSVVERALGCQHFAGEPYDVTEEGESERKKQIDDAMRRMQCERLEKDLLRTKTKYASNSSISDFLRRTTLE